MIKSDSNTVVAGCKSSNIPSSATAIDNSAFYLCTSLKTIAIPESIVSIGDLAFYSCTALETVYYSSSPEKWAEIAIGNSNECLLNASIIFEGDVNGDGAVNAIDSHIIRMILIGEYAPEDNSHLSRADLNGDKKVTSKDSYLLKKVLSE